MSKSIFISRDINTNSTLYSFCNNHSIELISKSLLKFHSIDFEIKERNYQIIFFNSPRCVDYFLSRYKVTHEQFACIGISTADHLKKFGVSSHFIGEKSSSPEHVFEQFSKWIKKKKVLMPHGVSSLLSIRSFIPESQLKLIEVYKTELVLSKIKSCDVYIFSSPSNVEAFFQGQNTIHKNAFIISWGSSTTEKLNKYNLHPNSELVFGLEEEIKDILINL